MTEHWVVLGQRVNTLLDFLNAYAHLLSHCLLTSLIVRYELVERWIEQTNINVATIHSLKDTIEVGLLIWKKLCKSLLATLYRVSQDHLTHCNNLLVIEEHMLCTCQTNTLSTECTSYLSIVWSICICANLHLCILVAKIHKLLEVA